MPALIAQVTITRSRAIAARAITDDHLAVHVLAVQRADVVVGAGLVERDRDALAALHLVVVLPVDLHGVGEVVVVRPGDTRAGSTSIVLGSKR